MTTTHRDLLDYHREVITLDEFMPEVRDGIRILAALMMKVPDDHELVVCELDPLGEGIDYEQLDLENPEDYDYGFAIMARKVVAE